MARGFTDQSLDWVLWCCIGVSRLGLLALIRDTSADKLSARAIPCVFLGFPMDSPDFSFYHPPLHHLPDFCDSPQQPSALLRQVTMDSGGVGSGSAAVGGTQYGGAHSRGAGVGGAGTGGASSGGARAGGAGTGGASSHGG
ncbi:unnamed protein product [Closterium sp. NIES-54]